MQARLSVVSSLYHGTDYLAAFLENLSRQNVFDELELLLVHNEPQSAELAILQPFIHQFPHQIQHMIVDGVEPLGTSWNRGWRAAQSEYIAIWNVDDRRVPDSLEHQVDWLEKHPEAVGCYGDLYEVSAYGSEEGVFIPTPAYSRGRFRRSFPQRGAFLVFRKSVTDTLGYFDEQLEVGPDLDFAWRIAAHGLSLGRVDGVMGYFTNAQKGLSTRDHGRRSAVERTALQMRYGVFDKVRFEYLAEVRTYRLSAVQNFGAWIALPDLLPGHRSYRALRQPLWLLAVVRNVMRSLFRRLGLLPAVHALQERYLQREI